MDHLVATKTVNDKPKYQRPDVDGTKLFLKRKRMAKDFDEGFLMDNPKLSNNPYI